MREGDPSAPNAWIAAPRPGWEERLREKRPFLSIVTPSFNQARYLEKTIESVLSQGYDRLEYIVMDGGSTDGSTEIIRRYSDRLAYWVSEPDRGQVDAINRGIQRSTGDIVAYINADDYYLPGAFAAAIDGFAAHPSAGFVYGSAVAIDEQEREIVKIPARAFDLDAFIFGVMYITQPAVFISRQALFEVGPFSADLEYVFDWDMFIRIGGRMPGVALPALMAVIRDYATTKTNTGGFERAEQIRRLVQQHSGQPFTIGSLHYYMWDLQRALASLGIPEDSGLHWEVRQVQIALGQMIAEDQFVHRVGASMPPARMLEREKQLVAQVIERDTEIFRLQRVVSEAVEVRDAEIRRLQTALLGDRRARRAYRLRSWLATARRLRDMLAALSASRLFAFAALLALQAKVMWGIARWRDLTAGDTSYYFAKANDWARLLRVDPLWSPLYLIYYGSLQWLFPNPITVTVAHRLLIVAVVDVLVLALLRRLLPHGLAWLLAAWFALLPIDFDTLYEVHLFAAVPTLAAALVVAHLPGHRGRAAALGILLAAALLVRNELLIAAALWAVACAVHERRRARSPAAGRRPVLLRPYATAVLLAVVAWAAVLARSNYDQPALRQKWRDKRTGNLCQIFAFGYAQRHPEWRGALWGRCPAVMTHVFGAPRPTWLEAVGANPRALLEHYGWNMHLISAGLELELFNCRAGPDDPDYVPSPRSARATALGVAVLALLLAGGALLWRDRTRWTRVWLRERASLWTVLACLLLTSAFVMVTQRPRPSYLFNQTVVLLAVIGMAALAVQRRCWPGLARQPLVPALALALIVAAPPYYGPTMHQAFGQRGPQLRLGVERLLPFRQQLRGSGLVAASFADDLCNYVVPEDRCRGVALADAANGKPPDVGWSRWLADHHLDWVYVDEPAWAQRRSQELVQELGSDPTWQRMTPASASTERSVVLRRRRSPP